jgi:hypothetical protein
VGDVSGAAGAAACGGASGSGASSTGAGGAGSAGRAGFGVTTRAVGDGGVSGGASPGSSTRTVRRGLIARAGRAGSGSGAGSGSTALTGSGSVGSGSVTTDSSVTSPSGSGGGVGFGALTSRGGPRRGRIDGSELLAVLVPFVLLLAAGLVANSWPAGRLRLRSRAVRSTNCRATISSIVLEALFTSMPCSRLSRSMTSWLGIPSTSATL